MLDCFIDFGILTWRRQDNKWKERGSEDERDRKRKASMGKESREKGRNKSKCLKSDNAKRNRMT